jgi:hypothetical protein
MELKNSRLILTEPDRIRHPNSETIAFCCDGIEVEINILTVFRLMAIIQKDAESRNESIGDMYERIGRKK